MLTPQRGGAMRANQCQNQVHARANKTFASKSLPLASKSPSVVVNTVNYGYREVSFHLRISTFQPLTFFYSMEMVFHSSGNA